MSQECATIFSTSPFGQQYPLPGKQDFDIEYQILKNLSDKAHSEGKEVVIVIGLNDSSIKTATVAASTNNLGIYSKFVIIWQPPTQADYWKIFASDQNITPISQLKSDRTYQLSYWENNNKGLLATFNSDCLKFADCVILNMQHYSAESNSENRKSFENSISELKKTMTLIGEKISPYCLVLIENTSAPGVTEFAANPVLKRIYEDREIESEPLLAHTFEQLKFKEANSPNSNESRRICAGCNYASRRRVISFLQSIFPKKDSPIAVMDTPLESEIAEVMDKSYLQTFTTLFKEWSDFTKRCGIDIKKLSLVINRTFFDDTFLQPVNSDPHQLSMAEIQHWAYSNILGSGSENSRTSTNSVL